MKKIGIIIATCALTSLAWAGNKDAKQTSTVVEFEKGTYELTQSQKSSLSKMLRNNKTNEELDVTIAAWADEPFPAQRKNLSKEQRRIAKKRIKSIKSYLKNTGTDFDDMEAYNMAERSGMMGRLFNSKGNKIKKSISSNNTSALKPTYQTIASKGDAGKAVLVFSIDD